MSRRIAIVAPSIDILGGQWIQARALMEHLEGVGWPVDLLRIDPPFPWGLGWVRRLPYARTVLNQALYIPSLLRLLKADVVHVFSASYWSFLLAPAPAMAVARAFGKRVILNYHSGEADDHLTRWGFLVHPWLRLAHEIVVPSEYLQEIFARHGYRTRVVQNVVDTSNFRYRDHRPEGLHLVSTRNLERHYRVDNTLEAFALVRVRYPQSTLSVVGYGSEEPQLRRLASSLGLTGIRFLGRVEPSDMPAVLDGADVFVNSSAVDNQPVSVLEAFAAGVPVVSTPTGDIANMVHDGETGLLVPAGDPAAMAKAVISLLEDPDRAAAMARRARGEVEKYSWAHVSERWVGVYTGRPT
jgi:glycosyltransferase involved in cell wall biosynthesis